MFFCLVPVCGIKLSISSFPELVDYKLGSLGSTQIYPKWLVICKFI